MAVNWERISKKLLIGAATSAAVITAIGSCVDGYEVYIIENGKQFAVVKSCRGGLFAHAHELIGCFNELKLIFTIKDAVYHSHLSNTDKYTIEYDSKEKTCKITNLVEPEVFDSTLTGISLHAHELKVLFYCDPLQQHIWPPSKN